MDEVKFEVIFDKEEEALGHELRQKFFNGSSGNCPSQGKVEGRRFWDFRAKTWKWEDAYSSVTQEVLSAAEEAEIIDSIEFAQDLDLMMIFLALHRDVFAEIDSFKRRNLVVKNLPLDGILKTARISDSNGDAKKLVDIGIIFSENSFMPFKKESHA